MEQVPSLLLYLRELFANEGGLFVVQNLPAGEAVADEIPLVKFPHDLLVVGDLKNLWVFVTSMAVADDTVAVGEFLQAGHPA